MCGEGTNSIQFYNRLEILLVNVTLSNRRNNACCKKEQTLPNPYFRADVLCASIHDRSRSAVDEVGVGLHAFMEFPVISCCDSFFLKPCKISIERVRSCFTLPVAHDFNFVWA